MKTEYKRIIDALIFAIIIYLGLCVVYQCIEDKHTSRPVEEINAIDSVKQENATIKEEIKLLDSIKNVKVEEVKNLDNDSTLKLFNDLIKR